MSIQMCNGCQQKTLKFAHLQQRTCSWIPRLCKRSVYTETTYASWMWRANGTMSVQLDGSRLRNSLVIRRTVVRNVVVIRRHQTRYQVSYSSK